MLIVLVRTVCGCLVVCDGGALVVVGICVA